MKRLIAGLILCLLAAPAAKADTIVGFWNFNGNTNNTVDGTAFTQTLGNINGNTLNGGYLSLPANYTVPGLPVGSDAYTISGFMRTTDGSVGQGIAGWGAYTVGNQVTAFRTNGNGYSHYWWGNDQAEVFQNTWGTAVTTGNWVHMAATSSGSDQKTYINGQLVASRDATGHNNTNAGTLTIGKTWNDEYVRGSLDNVSIYSNAAEHLDIINISSSRYNGMTNWWAAEDYKTGEKWIDRISGIAGTPSSTGNGFNKLPQANAKGVVFDRVTTGNIQDNKSDGNFIQIAAGDNPLNGKTEYTVLVNYTPQEVGTGWSNSNFYVSSGLVGAEEIDLVKDWGLGYMNNKRVIAGFGQTNAKGGDFALFSNSAVELDTEMVTAMTLSGKTLSIFMDGLLDSSAEVQTNEARGSYTMYIGRMGADVGIFKGIISDVRIYDRKLHDGEIAYYSGQMKSTHQYQIVNSASNVAEVAAGVNAANTMWVQETAGTNVDISTVPVTNLPLGMYVGGLTTKAVVTVTSAQLNGMNMALVLGGGEISVADSGTKFTKTLNVDGGTFNADTFSAENARITFYGGTFNVNTTSFKDTEMVLSTVYQIGNGQDQTLVLDNASITASSGGFNNSNGVMLIVGNTNNATLTMTNNSTVSMTNSKGNAEFCLGNEAAGNGTLIMNNGSLTARAINIGRSGTGLVEQNGGTFTTLGYISIGDQASGSGTYNLYAGNASAGTLSVGNRGTGEYNQTGGTMTAQSMSIGQSSATASGTATIDGGSVYVNNNTTLGSGSSNNNLLSVSNGLVQTKVELNVGASEQGSGDVIVGQGGMLSATGTNIGQSGTGSLTIDGGSATFLGSGWLSIADWGNGFSNGTVNLNSGSLWAKQGMIGNRGVGAFHQTGGYAWMSNYMIVGNDANADGTVSVSGGTLRVSGDLTISNNNRPGTVTLSDEGTLIVGGKMVIGANGTFNFDGGTLVAKTITGNLNQNGGTLQVSSPVTDTDSPYKGLTCRRYNSVTLPAATVEGWDNFWANLEASAPASTSHVAGFSDQGITDDNEYYALIHTGKLFLTNDCVYNFKEDCDDGIFLYIDNNLVLRDSTIDPGNTWDNDRIAQTELSAGWHDIKICYYEGFGGDYANLYWANGDSAYFININDSNQLFTEDYTASMETLTIQGKYTQAADSDLVMNIDLSSDKSDQIVANDFELNGTLTINFSGAGLDKDIPLFVDMDSITNLTGAIDFDSITINWLDGNEGIGSFDFNGLVSGGDGVLRYAGVPEPSTWAMLILGLLGLYWVGNRKRARCGSER